VAKKRCPIAATDAGASVVRGRTLARIPRGNINGKQSFIAVRVVESARELAIWSAAVGRGKRRRQQAADGDHG